MRSEAAAIRTSTFRNIVNGKAVIEHSDTFYAEVEFSNPQRAEALLGYGNGSKEGSKHIEDQVPLASRKELRPVWRSRKDIEANLEIRKLWK
jgi:acyl-homoserine-lactone acylase